APQQHSHFAPSPTPFVPPTDDGGVRLRRAEPGFRAVRTRACGIARNHVAAENPLLSWKMARLADYPEHICRSFIFARQRADCVAHVAVHVPYAEVAVRRVEYRLAVGGAFRIGFAPVQSDRLPRVAF